MGIREFGKAIDNKVKEDLKEHFQDRDYMIIAVAEKEPIRIYTLKATETVKRAQIIHGLSPIVAAATGRIICGALLLSSMIKHASPQKLVLKVESEGPVKSIVAEVDGYGNARCMVSTSSANLMTKEVNGRRKLDIGRLLYPGKLVVIKDIGMKDPYMGVVPLVSGEIGEDIAYYLWKSEQIPSAVAVGVLIGEDGTVKQAGGYLVQPLGGTSPKALEKIEAQVKKPPPVSDMLESGKRPEDIATELLEDMNPHLLGLKEVKYFCPCSEKIVKEVIASLTEYDIDKIFSEHPTLEVTCNYCRKSYRFTKEEVERLRKGNEANT